MSITVFFPVYNDENTVKRVTEKSLTVLKNLTDDYEVLIINDGSPDRSGEIADQLAAEHPNVVRVIHHEVNKGYGAAVRTGLENARKEWICFTDGDDEYDVYDLLRMYPLRKHYDLIITFRYVKLYSGLRQFISYTYNCVFRWLYRTQFRDISTGLRLIHRPILKNLNLESSSPFIGAEIVVKTMLKGHPIGEMGIQTFPREFGKGASTSVKNILATIKDMFSIYRKIFSPEYDLPPNRRQDPT
ncbi:MAG: glycosyltransferase family 2 protein [Bdellovibrionales bacterium]|nr:glycosyltransferase family 2 protein [Bdellovibrionales bacterium]